MLGTLPNGRSIAGFVGWPRCRNPFQKWPGMNHKNATHLQPARKRHRWQARTSPCPSWTFWNSAAWSQTNLFGASTSLRLFPVQQVGWWWWWWWWWWCLSDLFICRLLTTRFRALLVGPAFRNYVTTSLKENEWILSKPSPTLGHTRIRFMKG